MTTPLSRLHETPSRSPEPDLERDYARSIIRARLFDEPPQRLGRYQIVDKIGVGGMGIVYRARDLELDRVVAVKVLLGRHTQTRIRRLRIEARSLAKLNHPNVVEVLDSAEHDGHRYIVMEFVEGESLEQWLEGHDADFEETLRLFIEAGQGLQAAHGAGVIHRDFKPANVLVGADGRARVVDFGLALRETAKAPERTLRRRLEPEGDRLTTDGAVAGTPAYLSPEQCEGHSATSRSDQWAFAVSLFEALHGHHPFAGSSVAALLYSIEHEQIRWHGVDGEARAAVPRWLRKILLTALQPDPAARFDSMDALLDQLRAGRRRPRLVYAGVVSATLVAVGGVWLGASPTPAWCDRDPGLATVWNPSRRTELADGLRNSGLGNWGSTFALLETAVDDFAASWAGARRSVCEPDSHSTSRPETAQRCLDDIRSDLDGVLALLAQADIEAADRALDLLEPLPDPAGCVSASDVDPSPSSPALRSVAASADLLLRAGRIEQANELAKTTQARARELDDTPVLAWATVIRGTAEAELSNWDAAMQALQDGYFFALEANNEALAVRAAADLVRVAGTELRDYPKALQWFEYARGLAARGGSSAEVAYLQLATVARLTGDLAQAEAALEAGIGSAVRPSIREKLLFQRAALHFDRAELEAALQVLDGLEEEAAGRLGNDHGWLANLESLRSGLAYGQGHPAAAEAAALRMLSLQRVAYGPTSRFVAQGHQTVAVTMSQAGKFEQALEHFDHALELRETIYGEDSHHLVDVLANRGNALGILGRLADARADLERAVAIDEQMGNTAGLTSALVQLALAEVLFMTGDYPAAHDRYQQGLATLRTQAPENDPRAIHALWGMGASLAEQDIHEQALQTFERALEIVRRGSNRPNRWETKLLGSMAIDLAELGRESEAETHLVEALRISEETPEADEYEVSQVAWIYARLLVDQRRYTEAIPFARRAVEIRTRHPRGPHHLANAQFTLAEALVQQPPNRAEAIDLARTALEGVGGSDENIEAFLAAHDAL